MSYESGMRNTDWLTLGGILWILLLFQACEGPSKPLAEDLETIAKINGEVITVREFRQEMNYHRAGVFADFNRRYSREGTGDFWHHTFEGKTPLETLKERALESVCRYKMEQILMKEEGLVEDIRYETFLEQWEAENKTRLKAAETGDVIYGPVQYTERNYFQYLLTNGVIRLKLALAGGELNVTEDSLRQHFEKVKTERYGDKVGRFEDHRRDVQDNYLDSLYDDYLEKRLAESTIEVEDEVYNHYEQNNGKE